MYEFFVTSFLWGRGRQPPRRAGGKFSPSISPIPNPPKWVEEKQARAEAKSPVDSPPTSAFSSEQIAEKPQWSAAEEADLEAVGNGKYLAEHLHYGFHEALDC